MSFRDLRRAGHMGAFVPLHLAGDACHISCDGGRVCRPLIICDRGVPRVTNEHIGKLKAGEWGFEDFLKRGELCCRVLCAGSCRVLRCARCVTNAHTGKVKAGECGYEDFLMRSELCCRVLCGWEEGGLAKLEAGSAALKIDQSTVRVCPFKPLIQHLDMHLNLDKHKGLWHCARPLPFLSIVSPSLVPFPQIAGLIEYLDVDKESVTLIAMYESQCHFIVKSVA